MKKRYFLLLTLISLSCFGVTPEIAIKTPQSRRLNIGTQPTMTLRQGEVRIVADVSSRNLAFAARELAEFLGKSLECDIPIVSQPTGKGVNLMLGDSPHSRALGIKPRTFDRDGFVIRSDKNRIFIVGWDDYSIDPSRLITNNFRHGTLYGVYEFLERFVGVRFYFPGDFGVVVPRHQMLQLGTLDIYDRPDHIQRRIYEPDGVWFDDSLTTYRGMVLQDYRRRMQTAYIPNCHSLEWCGYFERFHKTHPEYFAIDAKGRRYFDLAHPSVGSLCLMNPGFRQELYLDAASFLRGEPASTRGVLNHRSSSGGKPAVGWSGNCFQPGYFNIMPGDHHRPCECPTCKAFRKTHGESEYIWNLIADIAGRLKKNGIPGYVTAMAYAQYREVPRCALPDNVKVMLAVPGPWAERDPWLKKENDRLIAAWTKKLGHKIWLWTYPSKLWSGRNPDIPQMAPRTVGTYYQRTASEVIGSFYEGETDRWIYNYLNTYVYGKVTWNNQVDVKGLIDEHHRLMFGAARQEMAQFYDQLEHIWMNRMLGKLTVTNLGPVNVPPDSRTIWEEIYSPRKLQELNQLFDRAEGRVAQDVQALAKVRFIRSQFLQPMMNRAAKYFQEKEALAHWEMVGPKLGEDETVTVDGVLDEAVWARAEKVYLLPIKSDLVEVKTTAQVCQSETDIYVAMECWEPHMDRLVARQTQRDHKDLWTDSDVEVFLCPNRGPTYYQFIFNSAGVIGDLRNTVFGADSQCDPSWNTEVQAATKKLADRWIIEVRIAKRDLGKLEPEHFKINFARHRALQGEKAKVPYYTWLFNGDRFHQREKYGRLLTTPRPSRSQIKNGDFTREYRLTWHPSSYEHTPESSVTFDDKVFVVGGRSAKLMSQGKYTYLLHGLNLKPNTTYALSFFMKLDKVTAIRTGGGFRIMIGDNHRHDFPDAPYTGTSGWMRQGFVLKTAADAGKVYPDRIRCVIFQLRDAKGTVWLDHVQFCELEGGKDRQ